VKPPIVGRERALIDALTAKLHRASRLQHETTRPAERPWGSSFEVHMFDSDDEPAGRVARVPVELVRVDPELAAAQEAGR
jgi:hypothetical protein